jgi:endonuclease-3
MTTWRTRTTESDRLWEERLNTIAGAIDSDFQASVNRIAAGHTGHEPYPVLVSTIISLRTRDEVTFAASERLLAEAPDPDRLHALSQERVQELIYPAGFYRTKAENLKRIAAILLSDYEGRVPNTVEALTALPGVGRKTANLVLGLGFAIPAICVDVHVHRIPNRLGWIATKNPQQSEHALMAILPQRFWIPVNQLLVGFGQQVCTPQSPWCSRCPLQKECPRNGVSRAR